jgi:hypothetical protein
MCVGLSSTINTDASEFSEHFWATVIGAISRMIGLDALADLVVAQIVANVRRQLVWACEGGKRGIRFRQRILG